MSDRIRGYVNRGPPGLPASGELLRPADLVNGLTDCLVQHMLGRLLKAIELGMALVRTERPAPFRR